MKSPNFDRKMERNSGIELLKIIAIILIIVFHMVQTLYSPNVNVINQDYLVDLSVATTSFRDFILILFSYCGVLGNNLFFVCSAFFLLQSSKYDKKKWFFILTEVWFISIVILVLTYIIRNGDISGELIIKSIFPTLFANNWYLTCYLLFYPIHPLLNVIILKLSKTQLFRISLAMFVIYCCFGLIDKEFFFASRIIIWIVIYFVMAYIQLYMVDFANNIKHNLNLLLIGTLGHLGIVFVTNMLGLQIAFFSDKVLHWISNCNPFIIIMSIALFNCMRKLDFRNKIINYISSLSLLIYILHDNIIVRIYLRPAMWNFIYEKYGYNHLMSWFFILVFVVFLSCLIISILYDKTIRLIVHRISNAMYKCTKNFYLRLEKFMMKFH